MHNLLTSGMTKKNKRLGKTSIKKKSKKGDIGHIRVWTYPPPLNSDIKNSDICSTFLDLPTHWNSDITFSKFGTLKTLIYLKLSVNMP